jgi:glutamate N-acetyltransferase/amino-acid N-acetyltransferase
VGKVEKSGRRSLSMQSKYRVSGFLFSGVSAGIKTDGKKDLGLIFSETPARIAGLFTKNAIKAAPVLLGMERLKYGLCQAILVNSGNANACTGAEGMRDAIRTSSSLSKHLHIEEKLVFPSSTGVIGVPLPVDKLEKAFTPLVKNLFPNGWEDTVEAIMTTDTFQKMEWATCRVSGKKVKLCGMAKGAGMIRPDMATVLSFLVTDADIKTPLLQRLLNRSVEDSFNRITVDGEMSTNDTVLLLANGRAGGSVWTGHGVEVFSDMLSEVCLGLAKNILRDGEGATKLIEIAVRGATSREEARIAAYAIAHSPLVKTSFFGENANWGRIFSALGHSGIRLHPERIDLQFDQVTIVKNGRRLDEATERKASRVMKKKSFKVIVDLHEGGNEFSVFTTDLSIDYVKINASYLS